MLKLDMTARPCCAAVALLLLAGCSGGNDPRADGPGNGDASGEIRPDENAPTDDIPLPDVDGDQGSNPNPNGGEVDDEGEGALVTDDPEGEGGSTTASALTAPRNLRGTAYTFEEVELFWDRGNDPRVVAWQVRRDGRNVARVQGPSFYESGLRDSTTYRYAVSPLTAAGVAGPAATLELATPGDLPVLTPATMRPLGARAFEELSLDGVSSMVDRAAEAYHRLFPEPPYAGTRACPGGGSVTAERRPGVLDESGERAEVRFDDCLTDGSRWRGTIETRQLSFASRGDDAESSRCESSFTGLSSRAAGELPVELDGRLTGRGPGIGELRFTGRHAVRDEAGSSIIDAGLVLRPGDRVEGRFTFQDRSTSNRPLVVDIVEPLRLLYDEALFDGGRMDVTDPRGNVLRLSPRYADSRHTWRAVLVDADGEREASYDETDGALPALRRPDTAPDCRLLYPVDGLVIDASRDRLPADSADPFSASRLAATLDTLFDLQRGVRIDEAYAWLVELQERAAESGWRSTSFLASESPEGALLEAWYGTATDVDEATGETEEVTYVIFDAEQTDLRCPEGGAFRSAVRYSGATVYGRDSVERCTANGVTTDARRDGVWSKYDGNDALDSFSREGMPGTSDVIGGFRGLYGALNNRVVRADRVSWREGNGTERTARDVKGYYNTYNATDPSSGGLIDDVAATFAAVVDDSAEGPGYALVSSGNLTPPPGASVDERGSLDAFGDTGSRLSIAFGNGDVGSFDVAVEGADGERYLRRHAYTERRRLRAY